jgi:hypothetical protein
LYIESEIGVALSMEHFLLRLSLLPALRNHNRQLVYRSLRSKVLIQ